VATPANIRSNVAWLYGQPGTSEQDG